ncbi:hypothetical protein Pcinc_023729 [Petrolisthes cinctipes]|uniref:Uncharacterized protein n=1 Tax=Petrolisthes cinctipes TaxID=88211 RepID=A0AAE1FEP5_PETCI|nr:hypothetical protein Pcinc_023729 [Petrolisthes cinctipes]
MEGHTLGVAHTGGELQAVGSQNVSVYLYRSTKDGFVYTRSGKMTGSQPLSCIDWSTSGRYIQTLTADYDNNATTERTLASLIESHQVIIATVTTFSEKLKALASRFELISDHVLKVPPQRSTQSGIASVTLPPSTSRKNRNT